MTGFSEFMGFIAGDPFLVHEGARAAGNVMAGEQERGFDAQSKSDIALLAARQRQKEVLESMQPPSDFMQGYISARATEIGEQGVADRLTGDSGAELSSHEEGVSQIMETFLGELGRLVEERPTTNRYRNMLYTVDVFSTEIDDDSARDTFLSITQLLGGDKGKMGEVTEKDSKRKGTKTKEVRIELPYALHLPPGDRKARGAWERVTTAYLRGKSLEEHVESVLKSQTPEERVAYVAMLHAVRDRAAQEILDKSKLQPYLLCSEKLDKTSGIVTRGLSFGLTRP